MHLENDRFTITYDPTHVSMAAIMEKIRGLGYKPEEMIGAEPTDEDQGTKKEPLPEMVASALAAAVEDDKILLLDFYAAWCAPCKVLEKDILTDADVKQAMKDYHLVKVDTDRYPAVAEYFKVRALPTLIVIDGGAKERYRHLGLIGVKGLVRDLSRALQQPEEVH